MMAVASLAGNDLARWVGRLDGADFGPDYDKGEHLITGGHSGRAPGIYNPHEDWAQGGPLIDKHNIDTGRSAAGGYFAEIWAAQPDGSDKCSVKYGPTRLIAAMRALVASLYGESVPSEVPA